MTHNWTSRTARALCNEVGEADPEIAIRALVEHRLAGLDSASVPVDLEFIVEELGINEVRYLDIPDGMLFDYGEECWIGINAKATHNRQRFTIAHEIIHFILPTHVPGIKHDSDTATFPRDNEEEYLCDLGASYILIPHHHLMRLTEKKRITAARIVSIAKQFDISVEAAIVSTCNRVNSAFLVSTWKPTADSGMVVDRIYRSQHLTYDFWLDAEERVSPTHDIASVSTQPTFRPRNPQFCLKRNDRRIYMGASYHALGPFGANVVAVFHPLPHETWKPLRPSG